MAIDRAEVEEQVRAWFRDAWDPDIALLAWRERLVASGWAVPSWSSRWHGRDLPAWSDRVAHRAIVDAGGVAVPPGGGFSLAAATIHDHADDELRERYLGPTLTGELRWCQLFSEPCAGSDLAGLRTTAVRDGDEWVLDGQKVWTTSADHADMGICVARSDWDVPKHAGLTYFLLDLRQPGVEVRPIHQMNGHASFNAVFLTEARVPADHVVGGVGEGWAVARGTLSHERSFTSSGSAPLDAHLGGRVVDEARAEAAEHQRTYVWYPQRQGRIDLAIGRAAQRGGARRGSPVGEPVPTPPARGVPGGRGSRSCEPGSCEAVARDRVAELVAVHRAAGWTADRARVARRLGRPPGAEGSIGKLALSEVARRCNAVHSTLAGAHGMLSEGLDPVDAVVAEVLVSTPAQSIAGGTDEIQRNILGETVLGLAREPAPDRGRPFGRVDASAGAERGPSPGRHPPPDHVAEAADPGTCDHDPTQERATPCRSTD
ncbi:acyl-CoA dehydrogenase family protein [Ilumatobacter sp.]|uniref:acyl-CoA dehydrogenase family protein n=1 Tax=Ilumatobacter sp. TaxID=1967498 RepID=UPI003B51948C